MTAVLATLAWWVTNLVAAICYFWAYGENVPKAEEQALWFRFLTADLTTASPGMMLATFLFPISAIWYRRLGWSLPDWLSDGFPRHWTLFVIYLGLAATLFGMVVALSAVGTKNMHSAERQQQQLTQLIAGTSTGIGEFTSGAGGCLCHVSAQNLS